MKITQKVTIDLARRGVTPLVDAVQGDSARELVIELLADGKAWTIPEDVDVMLRYCNIAGGGGTYDTLQDGTCAWSGAFNKLTVAIAHQVCAVPGDTHLQVTMMRRGVQISVFAVIIRVQRGATAVQENGDYTNLESWLNNHNRCLPEGGSVGQVLTIGETGAPVWADSVALTEAEEVMF